MASLPPGSGWFIAFMIALVVGSSLLGLSPSSGRRRGWSGKVWDIRWDRDPDPVGPADRAFGQEFPGAQRSDPRARHPWVSPAVVFVLAASPLVLFVLAPGWRALAVLVVMAELLAGALLLWFRRINGP